jgi:shikimate dehydrogenase
MHRAAYRAGGLDLRYEAIRVPESEFEDALRHLAELGYRGLNVTVPLKALAAQWCRSVDSLSRRSGASNTLSLADMEGINTDGPGFMDTLEGRQIRRALILGAGGSARAIALALSEADIEIGIFNRTRERAEGLVIELQLMAEVFDWPGVGGFDLIVNTTSASLKGESLDIDWRGLKPGALAYDLMYSREPTDFLIQASRSGADIMDGLNLLAAQGARSFSWWLGSEAPREIMLQAAREAF